MRSYNKQGYYSVRHDLHAFDWSVLKETNVEDSHKYLTSK